MKKLRIGTPYIYEINEKVRLAAEIEADEWKRELYFEVEPENEKYLVSEFSDCFVFALIYFCMVRGYDIECEQDMSEQLYYQLTTYFIPIKAMTDSLLHNIQIYTKREAYENKVTMQGGGVGASVSGGIDSFYTVVKHTENIDKTQRLTHLMLTNLFGTYGEETEVRERFRYLCEKMKPVANELRMPIITIYSNKFEFDFPHMIDYHSLSTCATVLALKKLFRVYYFASAYDFSEFDLSPSNKDSADYDLLNVQIISDRKLIFYSSGGELNRAMKTEYISDNAIVKKHLHVCNVRQDNCSSCRKCRRTLLTLDALNKLKDYERIFDITRYRKERKKALIEIYSQKTSFDLEIIKLMREKNVTPGIYVYIVSCFKRLYWLLLQKMNKKAWIRNLYYLLNIDVLRYGREQAMFYRFEHQDRGEGKGAATNTENKD